MLAAALHPNDFEIRPVRDFVIVLDENFAFARPNIAVIRG